MHGYFEQSLRGVRGGDGAARGVEEVQFFLLYNFFYHLLQSVFCRLWGVRFPIITERELAQVTTPANETAHNSNETALTTTKERREQS